MLNTFFKSLCWQEYMALFGKYVKRQCFNEIKLIINFYTHRNWNWALVPSVTWYPTGRREIKLLLLVFELTVSIRQRVTVRKECGSHRGDQMLVLSNLRSPDTKGEKREAKWLAGTPKRKWGLLPLSGSK